MGPSDATQSRALHWPHMGARVLRATSRLPQGSPSLPFPPGIRGARRHLRAEVGAPGGQPPVSSPGLPAPGGQVSWWSQTGPSGPGRPERAVTPGFSRDSPPTPPRGGAEEGGRAAAKAGWTCPPPAGPVTASQRRRRPVSSPVCTEAPGLGTTASPLFSDKKLGHRGLESTHRHQSRAHAPTGGGEGPATRSVTGEGPLRSISWFSSRVLGRSC